jgi:capsular polysaccharide biosynthesis protein
MELRQYFSIIFKRLWIVLLIPITAVGISAYLSFYVLDKVYESNTTLYVINKNEKSQFSIDYNDVLVGQQLVKDYSELVKSRTVTENVIDELKLKGLTPEDLARKINVDSKNDTRIIEIKVQDKDPETARNITDKVGEVFISKVVDLMKVENVSIIDKAEVPLSPVKPRPIINIAIALFAGLMAAIGIIFLLEYLDNTIKTSEDVEKLLGLSVLSTIPMMDIK